MYDLLYKNPYFFDTTWPNQMGSSLNCRKIVSFIIWFDFSDSIKGSFAIDTQMPIVFWGGQYTIHSCVCVFARARVCVCHFGVCVCVCT